MMALFGSFILVDMNVYMLHLTDYVVELLVTYKFSLLECRLLMVCRLIETLHVNFQLDGYFVYIETNYG